MAIGSKSSFIVNARTGHKQHFVGSYYRVGLTHCARSKTMLQRLKQFAIRFASIGSKVRVYYLW